MCTRVEGNGARVTGRCERPTYRQEVSLSEQSGSRCDPTCPHKGSVRLSELNSVKSLSGRDLVPSMDGSRASACSFPGKREVT